MSQLTKVIEASNAYTYRFDVALDRIPDPNEKQGIKSGIQDAMEQLGVPADQVAVRIFKSDVPPQLDTDNNEDPAFNAGLGYLLCLLVRNEPGVLQQDPAEIMREAVEEFSIYSGLPTEKFAAVVIENCFLEVNTNMKGGSLVEWAIF